MPIASDWTIDYANKILHHTSGTTVYSVNELYSWLMDVFDESGTIDDPIPMTAQTDTAYTFANGWFIDYPMDNCHQYLYGGSTTTLGWDATLFTGGIRILTFSASGYSDPAPSDVGTTVDYAGGSPADTGTLLAYQSSTRRWWVRVTSTSATYFSNTATQVRCNGTNRGTLSLASTTGENIWANPYTLGTIQNNTEIYVVQDNVNFTPWWSPGHIDILTLIKEAGTFIDEGKITFFARQYTKLYDHVISHLSSGGRIPVPIATFNDRNNTTGYWQFTGSAGSGTFQAGEVISFGTTAYGVITSVGGTVANPILTYYLHLYPFTNFANGNTPITGGTSAATCTAGTPSAVGPAALSPVITITFGTYSYDLLNGNGTRPYSVQIDGNGNTIENIYEYVKYITRDGESTTLNGYDGDQYYAIGDNYLNYESLAGGTFTLGNTVTGGTSGATGVIVSDHSTESSMVVRNVSGTFEVGETLTEGAVTATISTGGVEIIDPSKQSPFGTFAGGKFFGARGVLLIDMHADDANNYELIDTTNTRQVPPASISIAVNGLQSGDKVSVFRTTGNNEIIDRSQFTSHATNNTASSTSFEVQQTIPADTPTNGYIRVVDNSLNREARYAYTGWSGSTFTNLSPALTTTYEGTDTAYVPYIDTTSGGTSVSQSVTYAADTYVLTVVRMAGYQPFKIKGQVISTGYTTTAVRTPDSVYQ